MLDRQCGRMGVMVPDADERQALTRRPAAACIAVWASQTTACGEDPVQSLKIGNNLFEYRHAAGSIQVADMG